MALAVWPRELLTAGVVEWSPNVPSQGWTATLGGVPQTPFLSGGGFWRLNLADIFMRGRLAILAGRRLQGLLEGGVRPLVISPCDCRMAPLAPGQSLAGDASPIVASIAVAPLRATSGTITVTAGARALVAGDQFGIDNPTWGPRMHRLTRVLTTGEGVYAASFLPPLRQVVAEETAIDFNRPSCVMRLDGTFPIEHLVRNRLHTASAMFCELERPPTEDGL